MKLDNRGWGLGVFIVFLFIFVIMLITISILSHETEESIEEMLDKNKEKETEINTIEKANS